MYSAVTLHIADIEMPELCLDAGQEMGETKGNQRWCVVGDESPEQGPRNFVPLAPACFAHSPAGLHTAATSCSMH